MRFTKMEGCGNDYVYVNGFDNRIDDPGELARLLSDRHFGVGGDGMIMICPSDSADFRMRMYNADGSEGNMCGNGIRCVAKYVYDNRMTDKTEIKIETRSGIKHLNLNVEDGKMKSARVNMGSPALKPGEIPVLFSGERMVNEPVSIGGSEYKITCVSMGNPHAVTFVDDVEKLNLNEIGPGFENAEIFPDRVNTEFVQVIDRNTVKMRVWERGSGETLACGTGACACTVACVLNSLTEKEITVRLRGGELKIEYNTDENTVYMTGPARTVFTGEMDL